MFAGNIPGRLSVSLIESVSGAGATELCAGHLIWSSARVLLSREPRMRRPAQPQPGQREGVLSHQSGPGRGQTGNGLLNIIWNVDNIQTRGNSRGRTERPGMGNTVTTEWPGWGERAEGREDQYGHWWWWTVIHGQSGGVEIVPVIPAKIVNKWTHKHGALWGLWVSLLQTEAWSGSVGGEGEAGQWLEGNQNECQL